MRKARQWRARRERPSIGQTAMNTGIGYSYTRGGLSSLTGGRSNRNSSNSIRTYNPFADMISSMEDNSDVSQ